MNYPFRNSADVFLKDRQPFSCLAHTESPFDRDFPNRLPSAEAYDFDEITKKVCAYRSSREKRLLHSADALVISCVHGNADNGKLHRVFCFVEFKNQKVENIQSTKDPSDNTLMMKAFDSLSICAMTFSRDMAMSELQDSAVFVVVYPRQNYSDRFLDVLGKLASGDGVSKPLWNLDRLVDAGFYKRVLTIDDEEFTKIYSSELVHGFARPEEALK